MANTLLITFSSDSCLRKHKRQDAAVDTFEITGSSDGGDADASFTCTPPSNPVADKIAHRTALIPNDPAGVSALHVMISPRAPGPSSRPSGWMAGFRPSRMVFSVVMLAWDIPLFACLFLFMRTLSTFERMIWWEMPYCRSNIRMVLSVFFKPCKVSTRTNTRRSLWE